MAAPVMSSVVRSILSENLDLSADEVIRKARLYRVTAPEKSIRTTAHNIKSELKKRAEKKAEPEPVASSLPTGKNPEPVTVLTHTGGGVPVPALSSVSDLSAVLANVALVNSVVKESGGQKRFDGWQKPFGRVEVLRRFYNTSTS
ncbi:unnamed protein product [Gemmata massiliana]|uniref:Uncharacterized protein n=1 Tax=Gemmata massiliana TaxID=1210884 RepID=A0A6P2CWT4_9BACT|nr:hypothetical protein [Gemmata massiliana]VTR91562.1 unnamed protein product [Gemmata massiliana]